MKHILELMRDFDTVHIFVSRHSEGNTITLQDGRGNWCARYGQVMEYINFDVPDYIKRGREELHGRNSG